MNDNQLEISRLRLKQQQQQQQELETENDTLIQRTRNENKAETLGLGPRLKSLWNCVRRIEKLKLSIPNLHGYEIMENLFSFQIDN